MNNLILISPSKAWGFQPILCCTVSRLSVVCEGEMAEGAMERRFEDLRSAIAICSNLNKQQYTTTYSPII
ncbi:hypothetical protein [Microcoleus sp. CAWBG58]|uniref:hypothetical protein n=1 Tax=Microcoleus sp. CAWBG58 TaxID=2841651 RepID=UPI0025DF2EDD|nr:hypothetical protein [Microcoleus sp. CAWBG58]